MMLEGTQIATSGFLVWTHSTFENRGSHLNEDVGGAPLTGGNGGDAGNAPPLRTFFISHPLIDRVSLGLGGSTPFGLQTDWPRGWVGRYAGRFSQLQTFNFNPSLTVKLTDWLSIGGGANAEQIRNAFRILLSDKNVRAVLINIFGGILRCDVLAQGLIQAVRELSVAVPIVIRMEGTNVVEGKRLLAESGMNFTTADTMGDAARKAVELVGSHR